MEVPGYGLVTVDIVYGGAFYAIITDTELGVNVVDSTIEDIANAGQAVTSALQGSTVIEHPDSEDLSFLYGTIITDGKDEWHAEKPTSSICIFAEKQVITVLPYISFMNLNQLEKVNPIYWFLDVAVEQGRWSQGECDHTGL